MFTSLTNRLSDIFDRLRSRGVLSEDHVSSAVREIRIALLEADVALSVVKEFTEIIKEKAVGQEVLKSVTPGQMVIKIVYDELINLLGREPVELNFNAPTPAVILMMGLQGSGKTTSTAKIAKLLHDKEQRKVLMVSVDILRPAAQQQLEILGKQASIDTVPIVINEKPLAIAKRAYEAARLGGYDLLLVDTAGRLHMDDVLMAELKELTKFLNPVESLLVVDAMTGQDVVNIVTNFQQQIGISGLVLTRLDSDARAGAALSMRHVTGCPIKLMGTGEQLNAIEVFNSRRIADRILDKGDVVTLVERAAEIVDQESIEQMAVKLRKGEFDLNDFAKQLNQIAKLGGIGNLLSMLPGINKLKSQAQQLGMDDETIVHQLAIIHSMTAKERRLPKILNGSRRRRIALGSGRPVSEINRLLKQHQEMATAMKKLSILGDKGLKRQGLAKLFNR